MSANSFGEILKMTSFGESHGPALGVVLEGIPAGLKVDLSLLEQDLRRRRPGGDSDGDSKEVSESLLVSARKERDEAQILSGVYEGKTLGTPVAVVVFNKDARSDDYKNMAPRMGHADRVWKAKFEHVDPRGGGRSSGRETVSRVIAGAFAKMILKELCPEIRIYSRVLSLGPYRTSNQIIQNFLAADPDKVEEILSQHQLQLKELNLPLALDALGPQIPEMRNFLQDLKAKNDSVGAELFTVVRGIPVGLGQPVFRKLKSDLAQACLSVGAINSIKFGIDLSSENQSFQLGSQFHSGNMNVYGGIQGGISNAEPVYFEVEVKPTSSIGDVSRLGRHDPCIGLRVAPVLEAMTAFVLADHLLWSRLDQIKKN